MKKRRAPTAPKPAATAKSLLSPLPSIPSPSEFSPNPTDEAFGGCNSTLPAKTLSKKTTLIAPSDPFRRSPPAKTKTLSAVADLRNLASSQFESLKRHLDHCHSEAFKEIDASHTRISKRFKVQTQACLQLTEEAEKECKKIADKIRENTELMKASYVEFIAEAQASASRVCKVSIPKLAQSMEKTIESLDCRCKSLVQQCGQDSNSLMQLLNGLSSISGDLELNG